MVESSNQWNIRISDDAIQCVLYKVREDGYQKLSDILMLIDALGVVSTVNEDKIQKALNGEVEGDEFVIAEGRAPKHGIDGEIKFKVDVSAQTKFIPVIINDRIDYKNSMKRLPVHSGDLIGVVQHHTMGVYGVDVFGIELPARNGKPLDFKMGEGIAQESNMLFASSEGMPKFENHQLTIEECVVINGDVDASTGNIKTNFSVVIYGDVCEGYEVESQGEVKIYGAFHGNKLKSAGNITVFGGIQGHNLCKVECLGRLQAHMLNQVNAEVNNEVYVTKDILHSNINTLGVLNVNGAIIGGKSTVLQTVKVNAIGSEMATKTSLMVGVNFRLKRFYELKEALFDQLNLLYQKYETSIEKGKMEVALKGHLSDDIMKVNKDINLIKRIDENIEIAKKYEPDLKRVKIQVGDKIYADVEIASLHDRKKWIEDEDGPKLITIDEKTGRLSHD